MILLPDVVQKTKFSAFELWSMSGGRQKSGGEKMKARTRIFFKIIYSAVAASAIALFVFTALCAASMPDIFIVTDDSSVQNCSAMPALTLVKDDEQGAADQDGSRSGKLMFANIFPVKNVSIKSREDIKVIPGGNPFGVKMFTQGVVAVKTEEISANGENRCPAKEAGIEIGDTIKSVNGSVVLNNARLFELVNESEGRPLEFYVSRDGESFKTKVKPINTGGEYKIGLWIRDSSAGIGTVTFYCKGNKGFAGLGHGICDVDTGCLLPLDHGEIVKADIDTVTKGIKGTPGCLNGHFESVAATGELSDNLDTGVYGTVSDIPESYDEIYVASVQEVTTGGATMLTTINGDEPQEYEIEIESIAYDENNKTKNMVIRITDERLLESTGGIVQGMSGSPILQNGKLAGAVTHVFVNAPDKGYAIFAENMLTDYIESTNMITDEAA